MEKATGMSCKLFVFVGDRCTLISSLVAQTGKNLLAAWETKVQSLSWEDPLEGIAAHSSILAWRIPWTEKSSRLESMGLQRVGHD